MPSGGRPTYSYHDALDRQQGWGFTPEIHLDLGTPADTRTPLVPIQAGARWRIDWSKLR